MPQPATGPAGAAYVPAQSGLSDNAAGAIAYLTFIPAIIFLVIEPYSKKPFVRFHAMQSLLFNVLAAVIAIALWILLFVVFLIVSQVSGALATVLSLVSVLVWLVLGVAILAGWVLCLVKAFQGQYFKLPVIGNFAEKFSAK